ncbi:hypothetical protein EW026_g690 [Hermanssonia centrifuga]|uniref:Uncharacterized protein n=1 Tax=Hermanssonia centrifuga TaxID=98765 RepID=A0A4S4KVR8_9APHY|nr:hypothetical protein EW026_g690 [Hermanssonia centrifuga]
MPNITNAKCVLVVGATSGIGRALALAIHDLESHPTVIVAGRRQERLNELCSQGKRIKSVQIDSTSGRESLRQFAAKMVSEYPELDAVIFSAGIQHTFNFNEPEKIDLDKLEAELGTNYISIVTLITFLTPHFLKLSVSPIPSLPQDFLNNPWDTYH